MSAPALTTLNRSADSGVKQRLGDLPPLARVVAQRRRVAERQLAESEVRLARVLVAVAPEVVAPARHLELAGDVGQVDEHGRVGIAEPHDVHQELLVVGVADHLVVPQPGVADGLGPRQPLTPAHAARRTTTL